MDYTLPDNFIEFELGWYRKYDFEYEEDIFEIDWFILCFML